MSHPIVWFVSKKKLSLYFVKIKIKIKKLKVKARKKVTQLSLKKINFLFKGSHNKLKKEMEIIFRKHAHYEKQRDKINVIFSTFSSFLVSAEFFIFYLLFFFLFFIILLFCFDCSFEKEPKRAKAENISHSPLFLFN